MQNEVIMKEKEYLTYQGIEEVNTKGTIYFDMDGTIADLYGRPTWLEELQQELGTPYEEAAPLIDMELFRELVLELQQAGYRFGVISWLAKESTAEYKKVVRSAKRFWLDFYAFGLFEELHFVQYGTNKYSCAKDKNGILIDDDARCRRQWKAKSVDPTETDIIQFLQELLERD